MYLMKNLLKTTTQRQKKSPYKKMQQQTLKMLQRKSNNSLGSLQFANLKSSTKLEYRVSRENRA